MTVHVYAPPEHALEKDERECAASDPYVPHPAYEAVVVYHRDAMRVHGVWCCVACGVTCPEGGA